MDKDHGLKEGTWSKGDLMDRTIVYPGSIPLDTDLLSINRNSMIAIGALAQAVLGTGPVVDGLKCLPSSPASLEVIVGPGCVTQFTMVDALEYGSLPPNVANTIIKIGINLSPTSFVLNPPTASGQSINYLIQAAFQEADTRPVVLPYYNASNPSQPYSGPSNSGLPQSTVREQRVQLQLKAGVSANTGSQTTPAVDNGWIGLHVITVSYGQSAIDQAGIKVLPAAPFLDIKLPALRPGFGTGVRSFTGSGVFVVPSGVTQVEVELWGGGAGSFPSAPSMPSGGGSGGGYARKRVIGLTPGQSVEVTIGRGGDAGLVSGVSPSSGGSSSFGNYVSATGGSLNYLASHSVPSLGATPPGVGVGGDVNLGGSAGQVGMLNHGGTGGGAPMGGSQNSGTTGVPGVFPGGGASGPGTGADGLTRYDGAPGAGGLAVVRW